jgi:hypothetical protein
MQTVLWIAAVGAALLFLALTGLIGLMYALTAQWPFFRPATPSAEPQGVVAAPDSLADDEEHDRRRIAAALAVAVACAESDGATVLGTETPSNWRLLHRARRLGHPVVHRKIRS